VLVRAGSPKTEMPSDLRFLNRSEPGRTVLFDLQSPVQRFDSARRLVRLTW
jgi:hypothetical protein